jgi:predicted DNA-binding ribbon-helix-helix protein
MAKQGRGDRGRFASKSDDFRQVRSLRLADTTWEKLGAAASQQSITRADLIERLVESGALEQQPTTSGITLQQVEEAVTQILNDPQVTRNGKDKGSVRRALKALLSQLS